MGFANKHLLFYANCRRPSIGKTCEGGTWRPGDGFRDWSSTGTVIRLDDAGRSQGDCSQIEETSGLGPCGVATKMVFPWTLLRGVSVDRVCGFSRRIGVIDGTAWRFLTSEIRRTAPGTTKATANRRTNQLQRQLPQWYHPLSPCANRNCRDKERHRAKVSATCPVGRTRKVGLR
jgi:hypothetical protein